MLVAYLLPNICSRIDISQVGDRKEENHNATLARRMKGHAVLVVFLWYGILKLSSFVLYDPFSTKCYRSHRILFNL